jgi:hypothetical protein
LAKAREQKQPFVVTFFDDVPLIPEPDINMWDGTSNSMDLS